MQWVQPLTAALRASVIGSPQAWHSCADWLARGVWVADQRANAAARCRSSRSQARSIIWDMGFFLDTRGECIACDFALLKSVVGGLIGAD